MTDSHASKSPTVGSSTAMGICQAAKAIEPVRALLESLPFDAWVRDHNGRVVMQNRASCDRWGKQQGRTVEDAIHLPDAVRAAWASRNSRALAGETVLQIVRPEGSEETAAYLAVVSPLWSDGEVIGSLGVNVEAREREDAVVPVALDDAALQSQRLASIGLLAAGIAHDIRNAITPALASLDLVRTAVAATGAGEGRIASDLEQVREALDYVDNLSRQLVNFARPDPGRGRTDLNQAVRSALALSGVELRHRVRVETDLGSSRAVTGSPIRIGQVLLNLLLNAYQAVEGKGGLGVIRVATADVDGGARAVIEDNGSGIAPEVRPRLFEAFVSSRGPTEGTGLGLFRCRQLVSDAGGSIVIEEPPGGGVRAVVTLPFAD